MIPVRSTRLALLTALICGTGALAAGAPPAAGQVAARTAAAHPVPARPSAAGPVARPGTNLLLNPGAQTGAFSVQGWDSVTIPGWRVTSGLPTVVRYGTPGFPGDTKRWPAVPRGHLFAGGAGGTARLRQLVRLRSAAGSPLPGGTRYRLSGWLGGTARSQASVTAVFLSAAGRVLARRTIGPSGRDHGLSRRASTGVLPVGTASARVTLTLATTLTNIDGPGAPRVGYDRAVADGLRFSVSARVRRPPPLAAPPAHIPRYQHVFLFYFENQDFGSVIGNTKQAPYLNSLLPRASLLANFFAEEHPSDGNYLALAGGSTFGIPLTDPLEANPGYTIRARTIGDLAGAAHRTWKEYLQSANGPCDDTVHGYFWNDDLPMAYFADVRDRPAYCSAHLVPLQSLDADLASTATTPNFAWVGPNDCTDMEGCGIRAGDKFLAAELGAIMRSPAWRTQRSLAIITFDEDGFDHEHPAQRVATLLLGSAGVRHGYVSHVRYTHYSLLRTIEAALGLGNLTRNDRYAQPVNDAFATRPGSGAPARAAPPPFRGPARARTVGQARTGGAGPDRGPGTDRTRPGRQPGADRVRGELGFGHGDPDQPGNEAGRPGDQGRHRPAGDRDHPQRPHRLRRQHRLRHRHPHQHHHPPARPSHQGRHRPTGDRDHPQRPHRLRRQHRLRHRHPHQHHHPPARPSHQGRHRPTGHRDHPQRPHRLRARLGQRGGDTDRGRHRPRPPGHPGRQLPLRDRGRAGRPHRLRGQLRRQHGHADHGGHRAGRPCHPGGPGPGRARGFPGRLDRLRGGRRLRHAHPDRHHHRARWPAPAWVTRQRRSRSPGPARRRTW